MSILQLLSSESTRIYSVPLARRISVNGAIVLQEMIRWHLYYAERGELDSEFMFYVTAPKMEESTALTEREQSTAINHLKRLGLIEQKNKGLPAKRFFRVNVEAIEQLFVEQASQKRKADNSAVSEDDNSKNRATTSITKTQNLHHKSADNLLNLSLELKEDDNEDDHHHTHTRKNVVPIPSSKPNERTPGSTIHDNWVLAFKEHIDDKITRGQRKIFDSFISNGMQEEVICWVLSLLETRIADSPVIYAAKLITNFEESDIKTMAQATGQYKPFKKLL